MSTTPDDGRGTGAGRRYTDAETYERRVNDGWLPNLETVPPRWERGEDPPAVMTPAHVEIAHAGASVDDYLESGWIPKLSVDLGLGKDGPAWVYGEGSLTVWPMRAVDRQELGERHEFPEFSAWPGEQCRWPADDAPPRLDLDETDWDACGQPSDADVTTPPGARLRLRIPVCTPHLMMAYRAGWRQIGYPPAEGAEITSVGTWTGRASASAVTGFGPPTAQDWMRTAADILDRERHDNPVAADVDGLIAGQLRAHADELDASDAMLEAELGSMWAARWLALRSPRRIARGIAAIPVAWAARTFDRWYAGLIDDPDDE